MSTSERTAPAPGAAPTTPVAPPVYTRPPGKVRDDDVRPPLPGQVVDTVFFALATLAAGWLGWRLLDEVWRHSWWHLFLLVPFWALVAYLVLPRLQTLITSVYVPGYFIARTRTSDGLLGDPVNLAVDGTARQIHEVMTACGWVLADDITVRSSWGIILSSVLRRSYPAAPVSPLRLFGRRQCLAYQQEVEGNAAQRHHVRFWRCPDGWLLPGGHRVQWLGAGTYDRAVGLSLFTLQVTHKIDADIDVERDYIVDSIRFHVPGADFRLLENFSTGYHSRNGGGDAIRTDGDLPVVDLRAVPVPEVAAAALPAGVVRAARGYDDPQAEGGLASGDADRPADDVAPDPGHLPRPAALTAGCALVAGTVLVLLVTALRDILSGQGMEEFAGLDQSEVVPVVVVLAVFLGATYGAMGVLALLTYQGYARPRVWLLALTVVSIVSTESGRVTTDAESGTVLGGYLVLAVNVLILLLLTSQAARTWSRRTAQERRRARRAQRARRARRARGDRT
ncbi:LssY C-terminal domain-containing protein [Rhodococcus sp. IEGM 1408]|uniref:LssY C-terminal domain-containing protein n=1 Tax=Rhodococcus sp. IEGM 1408 TaxID=3082220 RepID=UPI002955DB2E|nr:LssY C-terminal domain-containing protein [Rhodococcus sp. IEGM 1408]MDV8002414.1 LssY C-terminal domain-containing protein [Rhodococcus sp. IEGM 1408]